MQSNQSAITCKETGDAVKLRNTCVKQILLRHLSGRQSKLAPRQRHIYSFDGVVVRFDNPTEYPINISMHVLPFLEAETFDLRNRHKQQRKKAFALIVQILEMHQGSLEYWNDLSGKSGKK